MYKNYSQLLEQTSAQITEIMPWDFVTYMSDNQDVLIVDVRETYEFERLRIDNSITAPRGILENACLWDFCETIPELAAARYRPILLVCRSGYRRALAALSMQLLGLEKVCSLKLGLKGLSYEDYPMFNVLNEQLNEDLADEWLTPPVREDQRAPGH